MCLQGVYDLQGLQGFTEFIVCRFIGFIGFVEFTKFSGFTVERAVAATGSLHSPEARDAWQRVCVIGRCALRIKREPCAALTNPKP